MRTFFSVCSSTGHGWSFLWPGFLLKSLRDEKQGQTNHQKPLETRDIQQKIKLTITDLKIRKIGKKGVGKTFWKNSKPAPQNNKDRS